jgi:hypothetical protein
MRAAAVGSLIILASISQAIAGSASVSDRTDMAVEIATDIRYYQKAGLPNPFRTKAVELGPTAVEDGKSAGSLALADWRSADGKTHGQVLFYGMCGWHVGSVSVGHRLAANDAKVFSGFLVSAKDFSKLAADLAALEPQHVAYLNPAPPETGC